MGRPASEEGRLIPNGGAEGEVVHSVRTEGVDPQQSALLKKRICELGLTVEGTRLQPLVEQLYAELEEKGISLRPKVYLSDEWGCPNGVAVIGVPFYLPSPELCQLEGELTGIAAEDDTEAMTYLRHEAGHAFNYAYRLYEKAEWKRYFGSFRRRYREDYRPKPFSARFVHHIPGWYAQKHPDDDFAETFAVWLTPESDWQERYARTPALSKLKYVDRAVRRYGRKAPLATDEELDVPVSELTMTLRQWYASDNGERATRISLPHIVDGDLEQLFPAGEGQDATEVLEGKRRELLSAVYEWTGINRAVLRKLFGRLLERVRALDLRIEEGQADARVLSAAVLLTTLAMNYECKGRFIED